MAYIPYVRYEDAKGLLEQLYQRFGGEGRVDSILRIHSLNPASMDHHHRYYAHLMRGPSELSRVQREILAVAVSAANNCFY